MNNKKKILIDVERVGKGWTGGIYYSINIAFLLTKNRYIIENYDIIIYCNKEQMQLLQIASPNTKYVLAPFKKSRINRIYKMLICIVDRVKVSYWGNSDYRLAKTKAVSWIPDFQHKFFPQYFTQDEIKNRDLVFEQIAKSKDSYLVLSSEESRRNYIDFYSPISSKQYVVPFVSYIEPIIRGLSESQEREILKKYELDGSYTCIMNQFWQHKNHKVVFEAMDILFKLHPDCGLSFVMTGKMEDYRNPEYIKSIRSSINKPEISSHVKLLGFLGRDEQIAIMKNATFIIQPSLFEGWGTVVEDAKVLDKTILLSDIPVHREQKNDKCTLFDPIDPNALAELIYNESLKDHHDDIEKGIQDMYVRAKEYSIGFEKLLKDLERAT